MKPKSIDNSPCQRSDEPKAMDVNHRSRSRNLSALTRTDVIVAITSVVIVVGAVLFLLPRWRQKSQTSVCVENLRQLGLALSLYERQNGGRLPYASMFYNNREQVNWDNLVEPFIKSPKAGAVVSDAAFFQCPFDPLGPAAWAQKYKLQRRSYAMPRHDMRSNNWPPGIDNGTGVGLWWNFGADGKKPPSAEIYDFANTNRQAAVTTGMIRDPRATLILTEQIGSNNIFHNASGSFITRTSDHLGTTGIAPELFQSGKINYLMVDGHTESLLPEQTVGKKGKAGQYIGGHLGMWTIRAGD